MAKKKVSGANLPAVPTANYAVLARDQAEVREVMTANMGASGIRPLSLDRISIPAGGGLAFEVPTLEGSVTREELEGVIIYWSDVRVYYAKEYTGEKVPPDCASEDCVTGIGNPGGACAKCPMAEFGSDPRGGRAQACKQCRRLFLCQSEDILPVMLTLPPTSVTTCAKHFQRLASRAIPFYGIESRLTLEKEKNQGGIVYSRVNIVAAGKPFSPELLDKWRGVHKMYGPLLAAVPLQDGEYTEGATDDTE